MFSKSLDLASEVEVWANTRESTPLNNFENVLLALEQIFH